MSHFIVLVVGPNPEEQLTPFHEFECTGVDDQYVQDIDITEEVLKEFIPIQEIPEEKQNLDDIEDQFGKTLEGVLEYRGLRVVDDEIKINKKKTHKFGYAIVKDGKLIKAVKRTNPNSKWDWYQMGGRWTGFFKLKPGKKGELGDRSLLTTLNPEHKGPEEDECDSARKGDIDFDGMRSEAVKKADEAFDYYAPAFKGKTIPSWTEVRKKHGENITAAREEFNNDPIEKEISRLASSRNDFIRDCPREHFCNGDRDAFISRARRRAIATFAVLKDGNWYEKGEMGWWGVVHGEKDQRDWLEEYEKLIDSISDDTLLTVVDCHI